MNINGSIWEQFEDMLKNHDWYYSYIDQNSEWRKGQNMEDAINNMYKSLQEIDKDRADTLYKKHNIRLKVTI